VPLIAALSGGVGKKITHGVQNSDKWVYLLRYNTMKSPESQPTFKRNVSSTARNQCEAYYKLRNTNDLEHYYALLREDMRK
jgi:hypothetical protein